MITNRCSMYGLLVLAILSTLHGVCTGANRNQRAAVTSTAKSTSDKQTGITRDELRQQVMRFADRYAAGINQATDRIIAQTQSPTQRASASRLKVASYTVAIDIAIGSDAVTNLLDALVLASLAHIVIQEHFVPHVFGEKLGTHLLTSAAKLEADIWQIANFVLLPDQKEILRSLISQWREDNPEQQYIWGIRFGEFSGQQAAQLQQVVRTGGLLGQIKQTRESIDEVRELGERTLFYVQRAAILARWQAIDGLYEVLSQPEIVALLKDTRTITTSIERITTTVDQLPEKRLEAIDQFMDRLGQERKDFVDQLVENETPATHVLTALQGTLVASSALLERLEKLMDRMPEKQSSDEPMDLAEMRQLMIETATTATELTTFISSVETLVGTSAWEQRVPEALKVVDHVEGDVQGVLLRLFIFFTATMLVFFGSLLTYRVCLMRLGGKHKA